LLANSSAATATICCRLFSPDILDGCALSGTAETIHCLL
jgi:hypothetical protein